LKTKLAEPHSSRAGAKILSSSPLENRAEKVAKMILFFYHFKSRAACTLNQNSYKLIFYDKAIISEYSAQKNLILTFRDILQHFLQWP
jgi:hypothetical protein